MSVHADDLTKRFGSRRGVTGLTFEVRPGEIFGFLGPNGAGKSTTIRLMMGLHRPSGGRIRVFGLDPVRDAVAIHRRTGYLPGELTLYPGLTGRQHLDRFGHVRGLQDHRYRDELVERFEVELDRRVASLSKGNRQKVAIVAAFMHRPELLVLDEPTSGLDPLLQAEFGRLLRETVEDGRTVFLSSHELDEVERVVDRLAIIKDGGLLVTDTVEGLRSRSPRTIELRFDRPLTGRVDTGALEHLDGVAVVEQRSDRLVLSLTGSVAPLLHVVAGLEPAELTARPADLDQLFLDYYRSGRETHRVH